MNLKTSQRKPIESLAFMVALHLVVCAVIFFDVFGARQLLGFIYFTTIPGLIFMKLIGLHETSTWSKILLSVGLSVAFLMLGGLLVNEFYLLFGLSEPLMMLPLLIFFSVLILAGWFIVYLRNDSVDLKNFTKLLRLSPLEALFLLLPALSILGAVYVNLYNSNVIILFTFIMMVLLVAASVILKKRVNPRFYPVAIIMIAVSLLFHSSLISTYIIPFGSDANIEYYVSKTVEESSFWNSTDTYFGNKVYQRINSMLSVTILPNVYSSLLNLELTWVYKIFYPILFAFVPLVLYTLWRIYVGTKFAFISTFLFMAESTFFTEMLGLNRQIVAELFFALLLFVIFSTKLKPTKKMFFFMFFAIALVLSHYALAEIFLLFIAVILASIIILKWPQRNINVFMVVFFFVIMFFWYIYTSGSAVFDSFLSFGGNVISQLGEFLNPASRGETILRGLGIGAAPSVWNWIGRLFAYLTQAFIVIGSLALILKPGGKNDKEYFLLNIFGVAFLASLLLVPGLASTLNMTRFYHILLFILAPLYVLGVDVFVKFFMKRRDQLVLTLMTLIVVSYFLFQTGFIYEVSGSDSWSLSLSMHRMNKIRLHSSIGYVYRQDVTSAIWLSEYVDPQGMLVYADAASRLNILIIHSVMYGGYIEKLTNTTDVAAGGTIYLSWLNIVEDVVIGKQYTWNVSELSPVINGNHKIYSNGGSEIYQNVNSSGM